MKRVILTDAARDDLKGIAAYTEQCWGVAQKRRYLAALRERIETLRDNSGLGRIRDEVGSGYRSLFAGSHVIFYFEEERVVKVVRILHQRMDLHGDFVE